MSAKQTKQATFLVLINEWLGSGSIAAMTPAEEGAYFRLCLHAAASEDGSLPDNDYELAQKSRLGEAWYAKPEKRAPKTSGERIRECFRVENGRLFQHQVDADRERYAQNVAKKKHAADTRWSAKKDAHAYAPALQMNQKNDAQDMQTHPPKHANAIPSPSPSPSPSPLTADAVRAAAPAIDGQVFASTLANELHEAHARNGLAPGAIHSTQHAIERMLTEEQDWQTFRGRMLASHAAWCRFWSTETGGFRPQVARWIRDGDWVHPPAARAATGRRSAKELIAAAMLEPPIGGRP